MLALEVPHFLDIVLFGELLLLWIAIHFSTVAIPILI